MLFIDEDKETFSESEQILRKKTGGIYNVRSI